MLSFLFPSTTLTQQPVESPQLGTASAPIIVKDDDDDNTRRRPVIIVKEEVIPPPSPIIMSSSPTSNVCHKLMEKYANFDRTSTSPLFINNNLETSDTTAMPPSSSEETNKKLILLTTKVNNLSSCVDYLVSLMVINFVLSIFIVYNR